MTHLAGPATASHVPSVVKDEVFPDVEYCDTEAFMDAVLVKDDGVLFQAVLKNMKDQKLYVDGKWAHFPTGKSHREKDYYDPFANSANAIFRAVDNNNRGGQPNAIQGVWLSHGSVTPTSSLPNTAKIRAKVNLFSGGDTEADLSVLRGTVKEAWEALSQNLSPPAANSKTGSSASNTDDFDLEAAEKELPDVNYGMDEPHNRPQTLSQDQLKSLMASWMRTVAMVEIKPDDWDKDECEDMDLETITQFLSYVRTKINIDKEPLKFIRVIASFRMLTPEQLGYDSTMKLLPRARPGVSTPVAAVESFSPTLSKEDLPTSRYEMCWEITIDGKKYRTIKPLSATPSQVMNGRATLVWLGIRIEDRQVVVIKQSWRPSGKGILSEYDLYQKGEAKKCKYLPTPLAYESLTSTDTSLVRQKIQFEVDSKAARQAETAEKTMGTDTVSETEDAMVETVPQGPDMSDLWEFIGRTQDRIVFKGLGWPIKQFKDLRELLTVYIHVLEAYEHLSKNGICHRDISPDNIMITFDEETQKIQGWLIGLDHAEYQHHEPETIAAMAERLPATQSDEDEITDVQCYFANPLMKMKQRVPDRQLICFLAWLSKPSSPAISHIKVIGMYHTLLERYKISAQPSDADPDDSLKLSDFGIPADLLIPPPFDSRWATRGTPGFMSHKLLTDLLPPPHKAIHDGESLFWTLVYLAITQAGPGGSRQDGLPRDTMSTDAQELLRRINIVRNWCFDSQDVGYNKMQLFTSDEDFQKHVIPYMNPYFRKPLTELFLELWGILKPAFYNEGWEIEREFPMFFMKKAFEKALRNLPPDAESDSRIQELVKKVEVQRQADRQLIEEAISSLSTDAERL
ncbi:hypothetical protein MD484_g2316, partial [Candolleomyces efflorescens]